VWNKNRIYTLAFIQNTADKDILNAAKSTINKTGTTGIKTLIDLGISIYPNPVSDFINIDLTNNQPTKVSLVNILGTQIIHKSMTTSEKLDVSNFGKGIYFLLIENSTGKATQKIIIK
ncbi:MAG: T9SS type A sorting domain-containing protein, partial [Bacteroidia bacterium]|nr:T9SS type A sorting domain-containing protein [Bacteroidia bacterium]